MNRVTRKDGLLEGASKLRCRRNPRCWGRMSQVEARRRAKALRMGEPGKFGGTVRKSVQGWVWRDRGEGWRARGETRLGRRRGRQTAKGPGLLQDA